MSSWAALLGASFEGRGCESPQDWRMWDLTTLFYALCLGELREIPHLFHCPQFTPNIERGRSGSLGW